jgi:hypothetical protein
VKGIFGRLAERVLASIEYRVAARVRLDAKSSPAAKAAQRQLFHRYRELVLAGSPPPLAETGFRCFSQFEEDGKLLFIFAALGVTRGTFVDVGAGDGIMSNCANLAVNFGWRGLFIDGSAENVARGKTFYREHRDTSTDPPRFIEARVTRENINDLVRGEGFEGDIDLLSIDIDGNDFWVWEALECVAPKVVIVETHVEFGDRSIVVPYDPDYSYPGRHPFYHGASPVAMTKPAASKGYRLVGANSYGFNLIYLRRGLAEEAVPEVEVRSVTDHPRNAERAAGFEEIKDWEYIEY